MASSTGRPAGPDSRPLKQQDTTPLAVARVRADLTQRQFAESIGVTIETVRRWEREEFMPSHRRFSVIAKALSVSEEAVEEWFYQSWNHAA